MLRTGYQVRVHQKIKEGEKERIQVFEGLVVSMNAGQGASKTFTVRKVVQGIGVEKVFPVYSNRIAKIEIKKTFGVRRAKLNFLRSTKGASKRLSAKLGLIEKDELHKKKKGLVEEEAPAEDSAKAEAEEIAPAAAETVTEEKAEAPAPEKTEEAKASTPEKTEEKAPEAKVEEPKAEKKEEAAKSEEPKKEEAKEEVKAEEKKE